MSKTPIITIDGPSGSGKGTIGQLLANYLGWRFLDSGSLYRVVAKIALEKNISLQDEKKFAIVILAVKLLSSSIMKEMSQAVKQTKMLLENFFVRNFPRIS